MQSGELTVTGKGESLIPLSGRPREVIVVFKREHHEPHPCNPHHHDKLEYRVESQDEDLKVHHKINHHHHDRLFFLLIKWEVEGIREIEWIVLY